MDKLVKKCEKVTEELLSSMGVNVGFSVSEDKENDAILVDIESSEETGLLIGTRGETVKALQSIIGIIVNKSEGDDWHRVLVNVADYREKQNDKITSLAEKTLERVRETGEEQPIYNLTPAERRIVHMKLSEDDSVETESVGEGNDRYLVVRPKASSN